MTEQEELLKLINGHIEAKSEGIDFEHGVADSTRAYFAGMRAIRWLVYDFFNAPKKEETPNDQQDFGL